MPEETQPVGRIEYVRRDREKWLKLTREADIVVE